MVSIDQTEEWLAVQDHWASLSKTHIRDLFANNPGRFRQFSLQAGGLLLDYSKNRITRETMAQLVALARRANLGSAIKSMYAGERLNTTENRAVLHVALRNRSNKPIYYAGADVMPEVSQSLHEMGQFVRQVRNGQWQGHTGKRITDIVNLGIGGSDLGPKLATEALKPYHTRLKVHFVSNLDATHLTETLSGLNPETTLFIISSKSFGTLETLSNARDAKQWLLDSLSSPGAVCKHFVAVSCNVKKALEFGIAAKNIFEFWDWVGGRFSLWSVIGLPIALAIGMESYLELLEGAYEMDEHFRTAPFHQNMPVILALLGIWYRSFGGYSNHGIFPYDQYLGLLPSYLQQLDMESNGKNVSINRQKIDYLTAPVIWGTAGSDGQHSYFQHLHQGTESFSCDFIAPVMSHNEKDDRHSNLLANMLSQSATLMQGRPEQEAQVAMDAAGLSSEEIQRLTAYKTFTGNRPNNVLLMDQLTPRTLGSLLALYEHKIFTQGIVWQINSFDQWGVELGKEGAQTLADELKNKTDNDTFDSSTQALLDHCRGIRDQKRSAKISTIKPDLDHPAGNSDKPNAKCTVSYIKA